MTNSPVFIVGSPRSGTSILTSALLRAGYNGFYEGNFLSLIRSVEQLVERHFKIFGTPHPKVMTSQIDPGALAQELAKVVMDAAERQNRQAPWLDKTGGPDMIEAIPVLRRRFPESRYVYAKRRPIENLVSRMIKFPHLSFEYHCTDWVRTLAAWRHLRKTAPADDLIEVDQREISTQPRAVAARLAEFLALDAGAASLIERTFTSQKPQETEAGSSSRVLSLATAGWSPEQLAIFHRICGEAMLAEGYATGESYWS